MTYIRDTLGNTVVLPIVIGVLGIALGQRWTKAIRSGLTVGVGFVGLGLVITLLLGALGPATSAIISRLGIHLTTMDVGWPVAAAIAFGTTIGAIIVPVALGVNVVMLVGRLTKTLNVDIWNFWHYAFTGSLVYLVTGHNYWAGLAAAAFHMILSLKVADITAPSVQKFFNLPGISIPQGFAVTTVPVVLAMNWVMDRIPFVKDIKADSESLQKRLGVMGDPLILGVILGILFGLVAGYSFAQTAILAVQLGAVMLLVPRIIAIFMEGLVPVSEAARVFFQKHFAGREYYVGLDSAILIGHPITIAASILLIPTVLILAAILPGNTTLPFADLAALAFFVAMATPLTKGNLFRTYVIGAVTMVMVLYLTSFFGPQLTTTAHEIGYKLPALTTGATAISALSAGNLFAFIAYISAQYLGIVGPVALLVLAIVGAYLLRNYQYFPKEVGVVTPPAPLEWTVPVASSVPPTEPSETGAGTAPTPVPTVAPEPPGPKPPAAPGRRVIG
ncbi:MAG TPA: PTS transporter subunit IIC [Candidatus Dormibacteraeota bacterium]|nr:PTS transporter subunit IIC [Candidatus Dormibacteraeota bacterium]